jgi:hypothetical protein
MPQPINWGHVSADIETAVQNVLKGDWQTVAGCAQAQIQAMVQNGKNIEQAYQNDEMDDDEYQTLQSVQKNALEGILSGYSAIGIVAAEQAADAAWSVVESALTKAGW